jgi:hypothetical protein
MTNDKLKQQNKELMAENKLLKQRYRSMYEYCKAVIHLTRVICNLDGKNDRD